MKNFFLTFYLSFQVLSILSAQDFNRIVLDTIIKKEILIGRCTREAFLDDRFSEWYLKNYQNYSPDPEIISQIRSLRIQPQIVIIFATWCGDTKRNLPAFMKISDLVDFDEKNFTMIAVNRRMKADNLDIGEYHVERVPTFIFFNEGKEIGRIIENPIETLEKDLLKILLNN